MPACGSTRLAISLRRGYDLHIACLSCSRVIEANAGLFKLELECGRPLGPRLSDEIAHQMSPLEP